MKYSGKSWKSLLLELYNYSPRNFTSEETDYSDSIYVLCKKMKIDKFDLSTSIMFLQQNHLIKSSAINNQVAYYELTQKGFEVALDLEKRLNDYENRRRSDSIQKGMLIFTAILATSAFFEYFIRYYNTREEILLIPLSFMGAAMIASIIYLFQKT